MKKEEAATCFPVFVRKNYAKAKRYIMAWLSFDDSGDEDLYYFQSLYFSQVDMAVEPFADQFNEEQLDAGFQDGSLRLIGDSDEAKIQKTLADLAPVAPVDDMEEQNDDDDDDDEEDSEADADAANTSHSLTMPVDGQRVVLAGRRGTLITRASDPTLPATKFKIIWDDSGGSFLISKVDELPSMSLSQIDEAQDIDFNAYIHSED